MSIVLSVSILPMFKVAIINCVYPPEPVVSAQMGRDLAEHLAQNGARVTVLCPFPTRPFGAVYQGTGEREQESEIRGQGSADSKQGSEDGRLRYEVETTPSQGGQPASLRSLNYAEPRMSDIRICRLFTCLHSLRRSPGCCRGCGKVSVSDGTCAVI